jgi:uncharacterized protein YwqG
MKILETSLGVYITPLYSVKTLIGGYGSSVQDPPVFLDEEYDQYEVLLKMDYEYHINWGDAGIANFLIKKEDLAILDFSKTEYWWYSC